MPRRPATSEPINTPLQNRRQATQRERLLKGMIAAANRHGYAGANVSAVIGEAGVSRPTFYDYFADRDDCFVAAVLDVQRRLLERVREAVSAASPRQALSAALAATLAETATLIEDAFARAPAGAFIPDVPVVAVLGAVHRLLASRLRRSERA